MSIPRITAALVALVGAACLLAGCIGPMNMGATRADAGYVAGTSDDLRRSDQGLAFGLEISWGTDEDPAFGPIYFAFAYSYAALDLPGFDDTVEHRAGTRWRSSWLDHTSSSYPYAALGLYGSLIRPGDEVESRTGVGIEGGYGFRWGPSDRVALDVDVIGSYAQFQGGFAAFSARMGAALVVRY